MPVDSVPMSGPSHILIIEGELMFKLASLQSSLGKTLRGGMSLTVLRRLCDGKIE